MRAVRAVRVVDMRVSVQGVLLSAAVGVVVGKYGIDPIHPSRIPDDWFATLQQFEMPSQKSISKVIT